MVPPNPLAGLWPRSDAADGRCPECRLPVAPVPLCICALAPRLATRTRLELIIHTREWRRFSNTGRLLCLAVANSGLRLHGVRGAAPGAATAGLNLSSDMLILFPGRRARPLDADFIAGLTGPVTLVVPDGNWTQTSHMMTRLPALREARVVELPMAAPELSRLRRNQQPGRMSTYEAVATALGLLEGAAVAEQLLDFYRRVEDRMLVLRGKLKAHQVYGGWPGSASNAPSAHKPLQKPES